MSFRMLLFTSTWNSAFTAIQKTRGTHVDGSNKLMFLEVLNNSCRLA